MLGKKKIEKKIPDNTYRVIKISKEAFFDVSDGTKIITSFDMDWEDDSFIMVAQNSNDEPPSYNEIDVHKISKAIDDTTKTMYAGNRYVELTQEQLDAIQEKE